MLSPCHHVQGSHIRVEEWLSYWLLLLWCGQSDDNIMACNEKLLHAERPPPLSFGGSQKCECSVWRSFIGTVMSMKFPSRG